MLSLKLLAVCIAQRPAVLAAFPVLEQIETFKLDPQLLDAPAMRDHHLRPC